MGKSSGSICLSWRNVSGAPGCKIAEQICKLSPDQQGSALLQLALKHIENVFFNPSWFDGLAKTSKSQLRSLVESGMDFLGSPPDASINLQLEFGLPLVEKLRWV